MKNRVIFRMCLLGMWVAILMFVFTACQAHTHVFGNGEIVKDATCTDSGLIKSVCSCGEEKNEVIPKSEHSSSKWIVVSEATCDSEGVKYKECDSCGEKFQLTNVEKTPHDIIKYSGQESTCVAVGFNAYEECSKCGYTTYNEIPKMEHSVDGVSDCETPKTCSVCGTKFADALGHKEVVLPAVAATCTTDGISEGKKCSVCDKIIVEQKNIYKKGHSYSNEDDDTCNDCGFTRTVVERYNVIPVEDMSNKPQTMYISFYDNDFEYHMFYLGRIENVPLQSSASVHKHNGNAYEKTFVSTSVTAEEIKETFTKLQETSVTHSVDVSTSYILGVELEGIVAAIECGVSEGVSVSTSNSQSKSIEKTINYSVSQTEETSFDFDEFKEQGYYRYILMGSIDVYGVLLKSLATGQYSTGSYNVIASQYYTLDYSKYSTFDERSDERLDFNLSLADIGYLVEPMIYVGDGVTYDSGYKAKKIDATYEYTYDEFDISKLSNFFSSNYEFTFDVEVYMKEENSGYQEIYLCKNDNTHVAGDGNYEHGGSGGANTSYAWAHFTWKIKGDQCTDVMKLRYGAHGDKSDDWYRAQAKVNVTVSKIK